MINRRAFLSGLIAAPAVVAATHLMPVKSFMWDRSVLFWARSLHLIDGRMSVVRLDGTIMDRGATTLMDWDGAARAILSDDPRALRDIGLAKDDLRSVGDCLFAYDGSKVVMPTYQRERNPLLVQTRYQSCNLMPA